MNVRAAILALSVLVAAALGLHASAQTPVSVLPPAVSKPQTAPAGSIPSPASFFGFAAGAVDRIADWTAIQNYFAMLAAKSPRVRTISAGSTTDGRPIMAAFVSAPENITRLAEIQEVNRLVGDPRRVVNDEQARALVRDQKVIVAIGFGGGQAEIGATHVASALLFELAASNDPKLLAVLRDVVVILIPSVNPDGLTREVEWHRQSAGTTFDGGTIPWPLHKYAGVDPGGDAFVLNLDESRALSALLARDWRPQVFLSIRGSARGGPRIFYPPAPLAADSGMDPLVSHEAGLLAHAVALTLASVDRPIAIAGADGSRAPLDARSAAFLGHNTVYLRLEPGAPDVDDGVASAKGVLGAASKYREELVANFYTAGRREIDRGRRGSPFAYIIPADQYDPAAARKLAYALIQAGVDVHQAQEPLVAGDAVYPAGTSLVLMSQPFGAYVRMLLDPQRASADRAPDRPASVEGRMGSLPMRMNVRVDRIDKPFEVSILSRLESVSIAPRFVVGQPKADYYFVDTKGSGGAVLIARAMAAGLQPEWTLESVDLDGYRYLAGTMVLRPAKAARQMAETLAKDYGARVYGARGRPPLSTTLAQARTGLYRPWIDGAGDGWTEWLLEHYGVPFKVIRDADVRAGGLRASFDAIILPSLDPASLREGNRKGTAPDSYAGGLGDAGVAALAAFVNDGGTLVCQGRASELAIDALKLPVRVVLHDAASVPGARSDSRGEPGSPIGISFESGNPLGFGMPPRAIAVIPPGVAFDVTDPRSALAAARYVQPEGIGGVKAEREPVMAGHPAIVEAGAGAGRAILVGFDPLCQGQSFATFRVLLNAILTSGRPPVAPPRKK